MSETRTRTGKLVTLAAAITALRSSDAVHPRSRANGSAPNLSRLGFWEWVWYWRGTGPVSLQSLPDLRLAVLLRPLCSGGPDVSVGIRYSLRRPRSTWPFIYTRGRYAKRTAR